MAAPLPFDKVSRLARDFSQAAKNNITLRLNGLPGGLKYVFVEMLESIFPAITFKVSRESKDIRVEIWTKSTGKLARRLTRSFNRASSNGSRVRPRIRGNTVYFDYYMGNTKVTHYRD